MTDAVAAGLSAAASRRGPGLWLGLGWAFSRAQDGGGISPLRLLWRTAVATLGYRKTMRRWMAAVAEVHARGLVQDLPGEYLRAVRPYVHRDTGFPARVVQLIDHIDWLETAFNANALERLASGQPIVLAELPAPRGYDYLRVLLRRAPVQSPEGELLVTLALQRAPDVQHKALPLEAGALGFSVFRIEGTPCLAIGGVRGPRDPMQRLSPVELAQALQGWKASVLLVRVTQELARWWNLRLVGLDPSAHRLQGLSYQWQQRHRATAARIFASYDALWDHFDASRGPRGWMVLPTSSDDKLAATALSPEKRERQARRADYWLRVRRLLRTGFGQLLQRPGRSARVSRITESLAPSTDASGSDWDDIEFASLGDVVPSRVLETGPASLT